MSRPYCRELSYKFFLPSFHFRVESWNHENQHLYGDSYRSILPHYGAQDPSDFDFNFDCLNESVVLEKVRFGFRVLKL